MPASQQPFDQQPTEPWHGRCDLHLLQRRGVTTHQGGCSAPLKLMRAERGADGRCQLPLLHTAGGLVGGDALTIRLEADRGSRGLITSVAAQKVYGSVGRSQLHPAGAWARQTCRFRLASGSDLEWMPQELVLFEGGLYEQTMRVELAPGASYLGAEIVRLGRTAAGETLGAGCWRSSQEIARHDTGSGGWELVDRLQLEGEALTSAHGMQRQPVFGSLVWAAPAPTDADTLATLLRQGREARNGLEGIMACDALDQGLIARYIGPSSREARLWFTRLWWLIRRARRLSMPQWPRVWPFQEDPLTGWSGETSQQAEPGSVHHEPE